MILTRRNPVQTQDFLALKSKAALTATGGIGATSAAGSWLDIIEGHASLISVGITFLAFLITWYYNRKKAKHEQEEHDLNMKIAMLEYKERKERRDRRSK